MFTGFISSAGWANSITGQKLSVCLSVSLSDSVSVCRLYNQGDTNHNRYTYKLIIILHWDPNISPWTFFPGYFPARTIPPYITPGHFPEQIPSQESFPPNTFPVALDDVPFAVGLAQTQFSQKQTRFSGIPGWIFTEPDHQYIESSDVYVVQQNASGHLAAAYGNCNCTPPGQLCLLLRLLSCRRVYISCFVALDHLRWLWRDIAYRNMPL